MVATAQRFSELHPTVNITWEKRSLQAFADFSIQELAERFDLLVIDHPWAGFAAKTKSIVPLDAYLTEGYLKDQAENSVVSLTRVIFTMNTFGHYRLMPLHLLPQAARIY